MRSLSRVSPVLLALMLVWLAVIVAMPAPVSLVKDYGLFGLLGITGAIFANATGAGGGVIFVPFFKQIGLDATVTVATSFAIQCCGMTAGALTWWLFYQRNHASDPQWSSTKTVLALTVPFSIGGILLAQWWQSISAGVGDADALHSAFGAFSVLLSLAIFITIPMMKRQQFAHRLGQADRWLLPFIALVGGAITAWLSVGVGELVAVYLIMRRFNVTFAIACAVILSAFSVWSAVGFHALLLNSVYWPVVLFAGAGAIIGGVLAKFLVLYFSPTHLKMFFAGWILLLGISALPL